MVEALICPGAHDDLDLLGEDLETLLSVEERESVRVVLALVPARAHPDLDTATRDVIDRDRHAGQHARMPEGRRRDHRAEPDTTRDRRQAGKRRPRVVSIGVRPDDRRVVIRAEEPLEPVLLGHPREAHPVVPGDTLLTLDHQADPHETTTSSGRVTGARQTKRSQT